MVGLSSDGVGRRFAALSFDDGPGADTPEILDLLAAHDAKGTFFLLGRAAAARPADVRRLAREGHELANHTYTHPRLGSLSPAELERELRSTSDLIASLTGSRPALFRPPYGLDGVAGIDAAASLGMATVRWTLNSKDRDGSAAETIAERVLRRVASGAVVVLHDGGDDRQATVQALRIALPVLREEGYALVTMSEALARSRWTRRHTIVRRHGPLRLAVRDLRARLGSPVSLVSLTPLAVSATSLV